MRRFSFRVLLVFAAFAGGAISVEAANAARDGEETYRKLAVFARVLNYVENNYVEAVDAERLIYGAIRGALATLDPHSIFMEPEQFAALRSEAQGEFGGIGVEIVKRDDRVVIVASHSGTPAHRAGLLPGDVILAIDEKKVRPASQVGSFALAEVVRRIKGPPGTKVKLTVETVHGQVRDVSVERARIKIDPVDYRQLESGFGYIRIKTFSERTAEGVGVALTALSKKKKIDGLIIDVRDNPGGLLDEAVRIADRWLKGGVIVSTEGRGRPPDVELAHTKGTQAPYPIVALVNGGTASASEILVGALQDHGRAMVVGTQTYGKGSVQTVIELEDQSAMKLTIARYYTPKHRSIQGVGITPDVAVPRPPSVETGSRRVDHQLEMAETLLKRWRSGQSASMR